MSPDNAAGTAATAAAQVKGVMREKESGLEARFTELADAVDAAFALRADQVRILNLALAGLAVRCRIGGARLGERIACAFAGRSSPPYPGGAAALTIDFVSLDETGAPLPSAMPGRECDRFSRWPTASADLYSSDDGRFVGSVSANECAWLDRASGRLTGYCVRTGEQSLFAIGRPLHFPLCVWHHDRGVRIVHAALVGRAGCGILLPGLSGSGKSTTAIACALAGLDYLGDDHVGVARTAAGIWQGYGIHGTAWLEPRQARSFGALAGALVEGRRPPDDKGLVFIEEIAPGVFRSHTTIRAIALPRPVDSDRSGFRPASRAEAFRAVCLGSIGSVIPRPAAADVEALARMVDELPCYHLDLGRRFGDIPSAVDSLAAEVRGS